jgi:hypothetical protein
MVSSSYLVKEMSSSCARNDGMVFLYLAAI